MLGANQEGPSPVEHRPEEPREGVFYDLRMASSLPWARALVDARIERWTKELTAAGLSDFQIVANGSIATGHFRGPKTRKHSLNPDVPAKYESVIEGDLRIILSENQDPHDPEIIKKVEKVTGAAVRPLTKIQRWDGEIAMAYLYTYEDLGGNVGIEWEVCINKEPYVEIAGYWNDIFTAQELEWQTEVRELLRALRVDYDTEFQEIKKQQCAHSRWRIVAAFALAELKENGEPLLDGIDLPAFATEEPHKLLEPFIERWLSGDEALSSVRWPKSAIPSPSKERIEAIRPELLHPPDAPVWVLAARSVQNLVRLQRESEGKRNGEGRDQSLGL